MNTLARFEVYRRPAMQGHFYLNPEPDFDNITDIFVITSRLDDHALIQEENEEDFIGYDGLFVDIVCSATASGRIYICLDFDGVEARVSKRGLLPPEELLEGANDGALLPAEKLNPFLLGLNRWMSAEGRAAWRSNRTILRGTDDGSSMS
jgi:hypothetical protein